MRVGRQAGGVRDYPLAHEHAFVHASVSVLKTLLRRDLLLLERLQLFRQQIVQVSAFISG